MDELPKTEETQETIVQSIREHDIDSIEAREQAIHSFDFNTGATTSLDPRTVQNTISTLSKKSSSGPSSSVPFNIFSRQQSRTEIETSFVEKSFFSEPLRMFSNLPSPLSLAPQSQPQPLFLQALSKLSDSALGHVIMHQIKMDAQIRMQSQQNPGFKTEELSAPDSLTSAPPSYSFVLRQMAARRPRLMGTFIPSPSFVQHTPPPNYAAAFDIYMDNPLPPPPPRVFNFSFTPTPSVCPECGFTGLSIVTTKITMCTHLCAFILCLFCCWICAPLPYMLNSCKDVYHYCRNCRNFLGMYCPTNPDSGYP